MKYKMKKPYWFEQKPGQHVAMKDGTVYEVRERGWKKIRTKHGLWIGPKIAEASAT